MDIVLLVLDSIILVLLLIVLFQLNKRRKDGK